MADELSRTIYFKDASGEISAVTLHPTDAAQAVAHHPAEYSLDGKTFAAPPVAHDVAVDPFED